MDIKENGTEVNDNHGEQVTPPQPPAEVEENPELSEYVKKSIEKVAENEGFTDYTFDIAAGSNHGDGFVAVILKITLIGTRMVNHQLKNDKLILIAKIPPENEQRKEFGMTAFKREIFVYNNVLPTFVKFQKDKGIKESEGFFSFPKCYLAQCDEELNDAIIIMEDIRERNYKMESKYQPAEYEYVRTLMEKLGQFHAISFAMKHQCPTEFAKFKQLTDIMSEPKSAEMMKPMFEMSTDRALSTLDQNEEIARQKLSSFRDNITAEIAKCTNGSLAEPYAVLNHGDCWINNMMFKYEGGDPKYICLLDWQITRYASPVLDLVYFIFICTNKTFREKYFDSLIQFYYKSLREHLERLGSDPNKVFPLTALLRQLKLFGRFGLAMALFIVPMLCTENDDLPDLDKLADEYKDMDKLKDIDMSQIFASTKKSDDIYKERMSSIIRHQVKFGFL